MEISHQSSKMPSKEKMAQCLDQSVPQDSAESFVTTVQLEPTKTTILLANACLVRISQSMQSILELLNNLVFVSMSALLIL